MNGADKRSRLAAIGTDHVVGAAIPSRKLQITFGPTKDPAIGTHWHVAIEFSAGLTVDQVCERLIGMAELLKEAESKYGHPVLTFGGH